MSGMDTFLRRKSGLPRPLPKVAEFEKGYFLSFCSSDKDDQRAMDIKTKVEHKVGRTKGRDFQAAFTQLALTQLGRISKADKAVCRGIAFSRFVPNLTEAFNRKATFLLTGDADVSGWPFGHKCAGKEIIFDFLEA